MTKALFIVNPISGGKKKERIISLIGRLLDRGRYDYDVVRTERPGHATELARDCDASLVVAVGGGGTVSEVACGIIAAGEAGRGKTLGIIPCGSGDGLALHLGISRNPRKAIDLLNHACPVAIDEGTVEGRPFFCTTGVGLDADVADLFSKSGKRGLLTYITTALRVWKHFRPDTYSITVDGRKLDTPAVFVTVGNANQWGNQARITPLASVRDGLLDISVVSPFRSIHIPGLVWKLMTGRANRSCRMTSLRGRSVRIERSLEGPAHYDGDPCTLGRSLSVSIVPGALKVAVDANHLNRI